MSDEDELGWAPTLAAAIGTTRSGEERGAPPPPAYGDDRYEFVKELGAGGMGRVIEARDQQFGRVVAVKLLADHLQEADQARRFVAEAVITGRLEHPGIPAVYERGVRDGRPFYAMRRVEGRTLAAVMKGAHTLADRLALLPAVVQVAHTLGFAHTRNVVHRDVKPENIVVGEHGEVVLLDWGIAKVIGQPIDEPAPGLVEGAPAVGTMDGEVIGTPAYMAPEQARGDVSQIDEKTDVFALGALLCHVLGGRSPFGDESSAAALVAAMESTPTPLAELAPDVPEPLRAIVERAMDRDPSRRYQDAHMVARALEAFVAGRLAAPPSGAVQIVATVVTSLALCALVGGITLALLSGPTLSDLGVVIWAVFAFAAAGVGLAAIELRTGGRHHLSSLVIAFAVCTMLLSLFDSIHGVVSLTELMRIGLSRAQMWEGIALAVLPMAIGSLFCALQMMLWALGRRAVARAQSSSPGGGVPG